MAISVQFSAELPSGTQGDTISIALVDYAGNPLNLSAVFSAQVALKDPNGVVHVYDATVIAATSTVTLLTESTMLVAPGIWELQVILNYSGGGVSKSAPLELSVEESIV